MDAQELLATVNRRMAPELIGMEHKLAGQYGHLFTEVIHSEGDEPPSAVSYGLSFSVVADDDDRADKGHTPVSQTATVTAALIRACREFREYEGAAVLNDALCGGLCVDGRNAWSKAPLSAATLKDILKAIGSTGRSARAVVVPVSLSEIESDVQEVLRDSNVTLVVNDYLEHGDVWFVTADAAEATFRRVVISPLVLTAEYDVATQSVLISATERTAFECCDTSAIFAASAACDSSKEPVDRPHRAALAA